MTTKLAILSAIATVSIRIDHIDLLVRAIIVLRLLYLRYIDHRHQHNAYMSITPPALDTYPVHPRHQ